MINIYNGMTFEMIRSDKSPKDICVSLDESESGKYRLVVYIDNDIQTEDFMDDFSDAFDSFTNIVKTVLKEEEKK